MRSVLARLFLTILLAPALFSQTPRIAALFGASEIIIKEGQPIIVRANFRINDNVIYKGEAPTLNELNQKNNAKPSLSLERTGFIFKTDKLFVNSQLVNTHGRRISFIREAYYFEGGILATTHPRGAHENDGPVELAFIDLKTMNARFAPYGSKIYWPLRLVEFPSSYIISKSTHFK